MQRNLTRSLYNGRYSFIIWTHFPDGAIEGSAHPLPHPPALLSSFPPYLTLFLFLSVPLYRLFFRHGILTKVVPAVIATTVWILDRHKATPKRANGYNISLDMQMPVASIMPYWAFSGDQITLRKRNKNKRNGIISIDDDDDRLRDGKNGAPFSHFRSRSNEILSHLSQHSLRRLSGVVIN